jgi:protein-S-isoprenylcysteine O-methyltransferase Ste14
MRAPKWVIDINMNTLRYVIALVLVIALPPLFLYWLLVHPFVNFWRGKGIGQAFTIILGVIIAGMIGLFSLRHFLLGIDYGTNYLFAALGVALLTVSGLLRLKLQKHLDLRTLLGLPEIAPDRFPRRLITEGIYGRLRHPRYAQLLIALFGYALIANYLAAYLAVGLWVPGIYVIAVLEEKELRAHFGESYDDYCRRVPRFLPKLKGDQRTKG